MLEPATEQVICQALQEARENIEVCGFLLRDRSNAQIFLRVWNSSPGPSQFSITRGELERVSKYADRCGCKLEAFLHSHASSLDLSPEDKRMLLSGTIPWVIVRKGSNKLEQRWHEREVSEDHP